MDVRNSFSVNEYVEGCLTQEQVFDYFETLQNGIIENDEHHHLIDMNLNYGRANLLIGESRLVGVSVYPEVCRAMADIKYTFATGFHVNNIKQKNFVFDRRTAWLLARNNQQWFIDTNFKDYDELYRYVLMNQKMALLDKVYKYIDSYRRQTANHLDKQDVIYLSKYLEAKEIIERNIESDDICTYPLTQGYADIYGLSLLEAAKVIYFKHENVVSMMSENENLRLRYTKIIREITDVDQITKVYHTFKSETTKYGKL